MTTIHTIERKPRVEQDGPPPLMLMLHGFGSNEQDLMGLAPYLDPRLHIVSARGVLDLDGFGFAWYYLYGTPGNLIPDKETRAQSLELLTKFVGSLPDRLGTDPRQLYLFGFSQGSIMSLSLALTMPERIAGVIAASGYLDEEIMPRVQPESLSALDVLMVHGTVDEVIPVEGGRGARDFLQTTPTRLVYREYPIGHSIHPDAVRLMQQWLTAQIDQRSGQKAE